MLQHMDNVVAASCILYFQDGIFDQFEQNKVCILTVIKIGIVKLIVQHDMIFSISFM